MDYGRSSSACGVELGGVYADTVELVYDNTLYDVPGWLSAPAVLNPVLSSEAKCQVLCAAHANCSYFSYEFELLNPAVVRLRVDHHHLLGHERLPVPWLVLGPGGVQHASQHRRGVPGSVRGHSRLRLLRVRVGGDGRRASPRVLPEAGLLVQRVPASRDGAIRAMVQPV